MAAIYNGTESNNNLYVIDPGRYGETATWNGFGGIDTLVWDPHAPFSGRFKLTLDSNGTTVLLDSISGVSAWHYKLNSIEKIEFSDTTIDLTARFPSAFSLADTTPPTISISSNDSTLTVGETATISFTLSEASTNFALADVTASGGTLSNFSGSGTIYTALFTPTTNSTTNGVVSVSSTKFTDAAGNNNTASNTVTMTVNTVPVNSNNAPTAKTATLAAKAATEGSAFSYKLDSKQFSDADKDVLTISATLQDNSTLPSWLTFNPTTKKLTGTPSYAAADTPSITIKFTADDGRGGTTSSTMLLNISNKATISGTAKADTIVAGAGADNIKGAAGNDNLTGGAGSDTLIGGAGNDTLTGGADSDYFLFDFAANASSNLDTIIDFVSGTDKLQFSKKIYKGLGNIVGNLTNDKFWASVGQTTAHSLTDRIIYDTVTGALYYDADGNKVGGVNAIQVAVIGTADSHPTLIYSDVLIVA